MWRLLLYPLTKSSFDLSPAGLHWVANYSQTRWFLVLQLTRPVNDELNKLLHACNLVAAALGHPPLYAAPTEPTMDSSYRQRGQRVHGGRGRGRDSSSSKFSQRRMPSKVQDLSSHFHISIAWALKAPSQEQIDHLQTLQISNLKDLCISVKAVKAKIGNTVASFPLFTKAVDSRGIVGT